MITARDHWLRITSEPDWRRNHIFDPNIPLGETVDAITAPFPGTVQRILEIGCGFGRLIAPITRRYPAAEVTGVDVNPHILAQAWGVGFGIRPRYVCTDSLEQFTGQDAIYSVAVFQHLPDSEKRAYIDGAYTALRAGGVLRVQFIEGDRDGFCDHLVPLDRMAGWCEAAGFVSTVFDWGFAHHQWTWLTAIK